MNDRIMHGDIFYANLNHEIGSEQKWILKYFVHQGDRIKMPLSSTLEKAM
ncbi:hypothetical protein [Clostridium sp. UBA2485]|nr:hypothetical protein [Clostridium sp. UBA2485]